MQAKPKDHVVRARQSAPVALLLALPAAAFGQAASPFMTGATALQTNILAWLTPIAIILVMALGGMAMANRVRSELAEALRAGYRERVQLRLQRAAQPAQVLDGAPTATNNAAVAGSHRDAPPAAPVTDLEEIRRQAREAWLRLRPKEAERAAQLRDGGHSGQRTGRQSEERESTQSAEEELGL